MQFWHSNTKTEFEERINLKKSRLENDILENDMRSNIILIICYNTSLSPVGTGKTDQMETHNNVKNIDDNTV